MRFPVTIPSIRWWWGAVVLHINMHCWNFPVLHRPYVAPCLHLWRVCVFASLWLSPTTSRCSGNIFAVVHMSPTAVITYPERVFPAAASHSFSSNRDHGEQWSRLELCVGPPVGGPWTLSLLFQSQISFHWGCVIRMSCPNAMVSAACSVYRRRAEGPLPTYLPNQILEVARIRFDCNWNDPWRPFFASTQLKSPSTIIVVDMARSKFGRSVLMEPSLSCCLSAPDGAYIFTSHTP